MYKVRVFFIFVGICTFFRNFSRLFFVTVHEKKMKQSAGWAY